MMMPGMMQNSTTFQKRNLDEVLCFKCGEKGHYANHCRNKNVPGNRGGLDRATMRRGDEED